MPYGIMNGMIVTIDKSGRIVVPKSIRQRLGTEIELLEQPEGVLLRPVTQEPAMVKIDGLWVHRGTPIPGADLTQAVHDAREERIASLIKL
jgi:AbrB family looped-hinge helix DNA binding protein